MRNLLNEVKLFLAGCSAVNNEKDKIDENDVFTAYKTLFKSLRQIYQN